LNLDKSISDLSKRIDRLDFLNGDGSDPNHWRGREIIPLNDWIHLRETPCALNYFPDDFDRFQTFLPEGELKDSEYQTKQWYSDYLDLMEYKRNPNYGKSKCFHCLLSPDQDDPIFIGINRLVAKGLVIDDNNNTSPEYPCCVVNRFECPYGSARENSMNTRLDVDHLFELARMAFAVEISLAVARNDLSAVQIKNKQDLYQVLTNREKT
jgi:hypothetical protein